MGNFLDTPITEKETEVGEDGKCSYGLSAMQVTGCHCHCRHITSLPSSTSTPSLLLLPAAGLARADGGRPHPDALGERRAAQRITIRRLRRPRRRHGRPLLGAPLPKAPDRRARRGRPQARPRRLRRQGEGGVRVVADGARQRAAAPAGRGVGAGPERLDLGPVPHLADVDRLRQHGRFARGPRARRRRRAALARPQAVQPGGEGADRGGGVARQIQPRQRRPRRLARPRRLRVQTLRDRRRRPPSRHRLPGGAPRRRASARPRARVPSIAPAPRAAPAGGLPRRLPARHLPASTPRATGTAR